MKKKPKKVMRPPGNSHLLGSAAPLASCKTNGDVKVMELYEYDKQNCEFCDAVFTNKYDHFIHNARHIIIPLINQTVHQCRECLFSFTSYEDLSLHSTTKHLTTTTHLDRRITSKTSLGDMKNKNATVSKESPKECEKTEKNKNCMKKNVPKKKEESNENITKKAEKVSKVPTILETVLNSKSVVKCCTSANRFIIGKNDNSLKFLEKKQPLVQCENISDMLEAMTDENIKNNITKNIKNNITKTNKKSTDDRDKTLRSIKKNVVKEKKKVQSTVKESKTVNGALTNGDVIVIDDDDDEIEARAIAKQNNEKKKDSSIRNKIVFEDDLDLRTENIGNENVSNAAHTGILKLAATSLTDNILHANAVAHTDISQLTESSVTGNILHANAVAHADISQFTESSLTSKILHANAVAHTDISKLAAISFTGNILHQNNGLGIKVISLCSEGSHDKSIDDDYILPDDGHMMNRILVPDNTYIIPNEAPGLIVPDLNTPQWIGPINGPVPELNKLNFGRLTVPIPNSQVFGKFMSGSQATDDTQKVTQDNHVSSSVVYKSSIHYDDLSSPGLYGCKRCRKKFPSRFLLISHEITHMRLRTSLLRGHDCPICDRYIAGNHWSLKRHMEKKHPTKLNRSYIFSKCKTCGLRYRKYERHIRNYHKIYVCHICRHRFEREDERSEHIEQKKCSKESYCDGETVKKFVQNTNAQDSYVECETVKLLKVCEMCYLFMKDRKNIKYVACGESSEVGKRQKCEVCQKEFFELKIVKRIHKWTKKEELSKKNSNVNKTRLKNMQSRLKKCNKLSQC